ncbi:uncharacterized protein B0T15DRAFT_191821 [Chaetomium strumarium]|uniref:DUF6594 domain-containing protein n=1 Tax=Chaetomium strumarium TaxID=1170767 RepID=A0AAJ0GSB4_9PEZI|nr:hypothetical protein B0T15DRAFT_191821 [Chaetomium strumarium]
MGRNETKHSDRGYYELANRMIVADNELAVFRNFKELNILCLLQLQAEISVLKSDLDSIRIKDDNNNEPIDIPYVNQELGFPEGVRALQYQPELFSSCFADMQQVYRSNPSHCPQYYKLLQLRAKLKEYNKLLLQFDQVCKMKQPEEIELLSIQKWTFERIVNNKFMKGPEGLAYRPSDLDRYVLVQKPDEEKDIFPPFLLHWYTRLYCWLSGKGMLDITLTRKLFLRSVESDDGLHFKQSYLVTVGNWLAPVLSSLLLVSASLILYSIHDRRNKLFAMIPLTVTFSLIVKGFTSASRAEIFVAVAGFVAVEVVFVGNVS